ncbi:MULTISPECIES: 6,7-dimethyl-8-ribityllumazine synthase [Anaerococcus]|jgi:6,7-dimethyl-8-ribityllumazine synthase|uniref:6,7-dimethyl-8-ribityllumazine synthase n=1 Tax=Anaerococcus octavius TaxID=54007 RepID=A0A2I1M3U4_9FIRM|nr:MULTISPECIES: 6,7-dimethyl-8-ribityllumazine synthase [Anaerococcus]MBS6106670.1 6,7-dimethyl-8-ribityllumazine synthase [Anaerococcus sp.]MDU2599747.1 6,7-dimethyl-8-ribityllumazine synthase [Anaerococcus sp.]MDU3177817.1 6,7-dimethyl-8-ribityllumazine synthase [Anaerococcus sp.]MDU4026653.1 6,7-dimethyl-8-ribityllumazine synthase [Anaerococcus sp.]MDU5228885.1 6,7-dimethyl-8-ribityllumazine synthase [Anaerococcus sp.]
MKEYSAELTSEGKKYAVVVARFNHFITDRLVEGCLDTLKRHGVKDEEIEIIRVPGAFEIPLAAQKASKKDYDAIITLGAVIRGDTPHFDYVCAEVSKGVANVSLNTGKPIIFGVITTDTIDQAIQRAGVKSGNKGSDAALSAIEMANLIDMF